ncbi:MAG TPA: Gfo/Idh/MocA family oxidoreductase [bacterium]|nr:Gfo/Idh/MocA family oxidoreductase [bacterium]
MDKIRFGILSTASVNIYSFLPEVKRVPGVELTAVASRDLSKAKKYATKHGIPRAFGDYDSLLADPDIDCVYIPLPISMHAEWSIKALDAGKHVLCEKPVAANEREVRKISGKVASSDLIFAEAFHYLYHPLTAKVEEIIKSGDIGEVRKIYSSFRVPVTDRGKVQFKPELAGGALLDIGCYPVSFSRVMSGCNDARVARVHAEMTPSGVEGSVNATLHFENGVIAEIDCGLTNYAPMVSRVEGSKGMIHILHPFRPAVYVGPLTVDIYVCLVAKGASVKNVRVKTITSYCAQLESFRESVRKGVQPKTNAKEASANMRLLDMISERAKRTKL